MIPHLEEAAERGQWKVVNQASMGRDFFNQNKQMQIKIFTIPILGSEQMLEEMNVFLRSKKVLQTEQSLVNTPQGAYWSFCVRYLEDTPSYTQNRKKPKIDYKFVLDEASFSRFSKMREIRRQLSKEEAIPAYAIFTDAELAELAKMETLSLGSIKKVKGIGEKKVAKYGHHFVSQSTDKDETGKLFD